ncbi:hypothetical protein [Fibrella forsythiae]|uniref:Uncharacterized protein n=1 Tax=Fibrella forsythiae TaxID=2817061 RepID=A0ABS3JAX6_9BACT|nr:hypothetical protein [Fibrella forsythiae]MBO0947127.1 hypothetical protein [Fibrella forsythiae]
MTGYTETELRALVRTLAATQISMNGVSLIDGVKQAFKTKPFIYGTQGKGGGGLKLGGIMAASINNKVTFKNGKPAFEAGSQGYAFQTGTRQTVQRRHNYQMMDMYYGDGGNVGLRADPFIMEFVLYATKLKPLPTPGSSEQLSATQTHENHPFALFKAIGVDKAWEKNAVTTAAYGQDTFRGHDMTGTKELSRIIRWCVGEFGGTIIFEGVDVYYDQVFNESARFGDTELEAADLFQYFKPGHSEASFGHGNGRIIFHWQGTQTVPSKLLFLTSWKYDSFAAAQWYKLTHPENFESTLKSILHNPGQIRPTGTPTSWGGDTFDASHTANKLGSVVYKTNASAGHGVKKIIKIDEKDIDAITNKINIQNRNLWNNFSALPQHVAPWQIAKWLESMA